MKGRHPLLARSLLVIGLAIAVACPAFAGTDQVTLILNAPDKAARVAELIDPLLPKDADGEH